jgi:tRNA pseudouridine13 synthase
MSASALALPLLTADLPGTGGVLRAQDEDFAVAEIPAYDASGEGDHVFALIEKRGLTTMDAVAQVAAALDLPPRDIGYAGMKDRHAVTRQWLSLPPPCSPEAALALALPGLAVLEAKRHPHKLRTGHLRGNRFTLRVRDVDGGAALAAERARAVLDRLGTPPGSPNWYGAQRFGADARNAELGRALVAGERLGGRPPDGRRRRLYVSALQSELFNEYLKRRIEDGLYARVLEGDLLQKRSSGGVFASTDPAADQARLDAGEVCPTGPMVGHKVKGPPAGTAAAAREQALLDAHGLTPASFKAVGKLAPGARRALAVDLGPTTVAPLGDDAIELSFSLPAGAYATAVMREVIKGPSDFPG